MQATSEFSLDVSIDRDGGYCCVEFVFMCGTNQYALIRLFDVAACTKQDRMDFLAHKRDELVVCESNGVEMFWMPDNLCFKSGADEDGRIGVYVPESVAMKALTTFCNYDFI